MQRTKLTQQDERRIAVEARVDPRTVRRYLLGELRRRSTIEHIEAALETMGFASLVRRAAAADPHPLG